MKRLRPILVLLFLVLSLGVRSLWAEDLAAFTQKIQKTYDSTQDVAMDFTQKTYVAVLEKEVSKKGSARFKKPGKFSIRYEGAGGRQYLSNGKTLWIYEAGDSQVQQAPANEESLASEALIFLGGLGNLTRDFAVEEVDPKKVEKLKISLGDLRWVELTPLKKKSTLQWLIMGFDKDKAIAKEIYLLTESENISHYLMDRVQFNTGVADTEFEYQKSK